jgi:hypothetical protein
MVVMLGDSLTEWGDWSALLARGDVENHGVAGETLDEVARACPRWRGRGPTSCSRWRA